MTTSPVVTILGVGALGSHLALLLRNESFAMRVVDFDRVESKNTQAQFHGYPQDGKLKVQSLADTLKFLFKTAIASKFSSKLIETNVKELLEGSSLVVDCFDNGTSRRIVQKHVRQHGIPCLHGGLSGDGTFGLVQWDEHFQVDDEPAGAATCEDGRFLPFIALTSSCLALAVQTFLKEGKRVGYSVTPNGVVRS